MAIEIIATLDIVVVLVVIKRARDVTTAPELIGERGRWPDGTEIRRAYRETQANARSASEAAVHAQHAFHLRKMATDEFDRSSITPSRPADWPRRQEPRIQSVECSRVFPEILTEPDWSALIIGRVFRALRAVA
jgi:hypothetical protein